MSDFGMANQVATTLTPAERAAVDELVAGARAILGDEIRDVRLFGSRARGEGTADSDVDVALVVTAEGRRRRREVQDLAFDIGLRRGIALAPLVVDEAVLAEMRERELRFALDLEREGIPL
jgi:predicted nucleotidyltransferase